MDDDYGPSKSDSADAFIDAPRYKLLSSSTEQINDCTHTFEQSQSDTVVVGVVCQLYKYGDNRREERYVFSAPKQQNPCGRRQRSNRPAERVRMHGDSSPGQVRKGGRKDVKSRGVCACGPCLEQIKVRA